MHVDFASITAYQRYKLMASLIVPRPIALVTTINADGVVNAAPFSMFNMLGEEPPLVMISINLLASGGLKDTAANIVTSGQFVVHLADEAIAAKMHACGEALPAHQSELDKVGLTTAPSVEIAPPRIAEAPVAFECALWETIRTDSRLIFFGKVLHLHAREGLIDTKAWRVSLQDYFPVGRFGASFYVTTRDRFSLEDEAGKVRETEIDRI
ncbi:MULTISPECIES: flavin reductase family protein [Caulobacter]|uniref:flavin reductase family protein n=1 Tax=Caulobacter TaxID=75 RepID=UPI000D58336A|nr:MULTISPECIES: flavin reductase family protein [Caulobacter]MDG2528963.1 flavin reductase family protein [Caulobacter endophyticus]PVM88373.1 flavin reductase family protein [Caulobacter radicis]